MTLILAKFMQWLEPWRFVFFGLVFWGSVINAVFAAQTAWWVTPLCYAVGALLGLLARYRGYWL